MTEPHPMVVAMAKAIVCAQTTLPEDAWPQMHPAEQAHWIGCAQAALSTLLHPTEDMIKAGKQVELASRFSEKGLNPALRMPAREVFTTMIRQAIGDDS